MIEKTSVNDQFSWLKVQDLSDDDHNELREKYNGSLSNGVEG
ncbi:hypothetical protein C5L31_001358 [Secundilactobacillus malefermentans]|uniref:Uncharacterized protein n=1 Tax=Secundilactobacillus malefermentans TaxID=176292 RepID=A0A4R5NNE1_9LACO|nr:hypothetical protein [Secundilactobacillus malefermentans]TDG77624.1 hypothetical protein C5L31_001358 [Secundilactobacillus malefermentans]